jgi:hypothetical protein
MGVHAGLAPAPRRPNSRRMARVVLAGGASAMMLFCSMGVGIAQECPITDRTCVIDAVQDPAGHVQATVEDTVANARDDIATTADTAEATLHDLTGSVGDQPGGGNGEGSNSHDGGGTNHDGGGSATGSRRPVGSAARPSIQVREAGAITSIGTATIGRSDAGSGDPAHQTPGAAGQLGEAAAGIALSLLVVLGAVLLFIAFQARLDRRDPKLALAPVTADVVAFE